MTPAPLSLLPPRPLRSDIRRDFALDPGIDFLNHGSFGARPRSVLDAQARRRLEFEARPIEWLDRRRNDMLQRAKAALAPIIGAQPHNVGFVTNATAGIFAVLRSLPFKPGDELLTTNHVYNGVRQGMKYIAQRSGALYIEATVPFPLACADDVIEPIVRAITDRTRLLVIDHITSPTAVIFPVQQIVQRCQSRGIDVIIDGAHAPGMIPLDVESLGAAFYAGNLHKWLCAPPGAAFLWVRPDRQAGIHPPVISHFLDESFTAEFNWQGTRDITPWLCTEDAAAYLSGLGMQRVQQHNHELAAWVQQLLCDRWHVPFATPADGSMIGSMATVQLPLQQNLKQMFTDAASLQRRLYERYRIEVPVVDWDGRWWVRPCCQVYNEAAQFERLANAVLEVVADR